MAKKSKGRKAKFDKKNGVVDLEEYRQERSRKSREDNSKRREEPAEETPVEAKPARHGKKKKYRRKKLSRTRVIVYVVVICVLAGMIGYSTYNIYKVQSAHNELLAEQTKLTKEKKEYQAILKNIDNSDYVEQEARDKLKMVMPGETLYVLPESSDDSK